MDPDTIGQRTRSKLAKGEYDEDSDYLMPVVNDAVIFSSSTMTASDQSELPSGILEHWTFCNEFQLSPCQNSCELDNNFQRPQIESTENQVAKQESVRNNDCGAKEEWGLQQK